RLAATAAIADTLGTAWAVALCGNDQRARPFICRSVPPGRNMEALSPLPIEALRLSRATVALLHELGFYTIEPLFQLPREALAERFEPELIQRLDQAAGLVPELFTPYR